MLISEEGTQKNNCSIALLKERILEHGYVTAQNDIECLANSTDWFTRSELARMLSDYPNTHARLVLLKLLQDTHYLVQVEAIDSLAAQAYDPVVVSEVAKCAQSIHPLVRGYAYRYICLVNTETNEGIIRFLEGRPFEKNTWARIMLYIGLAQNGDNTKVDDLIKMYNRCGYLNRCAIANGFADIFCDLCETEREKVRDFVCQRKDDKREIAEKEAFCRLQQAICQI